LISSITRGTGKRRVAALSLAVGAVFALGACGDDEDTTTTTTTSVPSGTTDTSSSGEIPAELEDALRTNLLDTQGLTEAQADCAIDYIKEKAGDELAEAGETGEVSENLTDVSFDAGVECADAE
jgi:uncharacterized protein YgiB involved in biofilm formation